MINTTHCPISGESTKEERVNYWTHLIGLLLSLLGWVVLIAFASMTEGRTQVISCTVYGTSLVFLYGASSYYHGCKKIARKSILKIVDHACIYLLIAGSYTPFALGPLENHGGWTLLYIEWGIAAVGILLKILAINRFNILSLLAYLAMGWLVLFSLPTVIEVLSTSVIVCLGVGGISYSIGVLFYIWDDLPYNHMIWHLFVLVGSICHYFAILSITI